MFGNQHRLPLRQNEHGGDEFEGFSDAGQVGEGRERFVEGNVFVVGALPATRSVRVGAEYVVVDQKVRRTQRLDALCISLDRPRIRTDFVVWKNRPVLHLPSVRSRAEPFNLFNLTPDGKRI